MDKIEQLKSLKQGDKVAVYSTNYWHCNSDFDIYEVERVTKSRLTLKGTERWISLSSGYAKQKHCRDARVEVLSPEMQAEYDEYKRETVRRTAIRPRFEIAMRDLNRSNISADMMNAIVEAYERVTKGANVE
jgi:hypothetical protein